MFYKVRAPHDRHHLQPDETFFNGLGGVLLDEAPDAELSVKIKQTERFTHVLSPLKMTKHEGKREEMVLPLLLTASLVLTGTALARAGKSAKMNVMYFVSDDLR